MRIKSKHSKGAAVTNMLVERGKQQKVIAAKKLAILKQIVARQIIRFIGWIST